jgi:hypothetical protein
MCSRISSSPERVLTYASWRPIHQKCLEFERLMMARAVRIVTASRGLIGSSAFTLDSVYFKGRQPGAQAGHRE